MTIQWNREIHWFDYTVEWYETVNKDEESLCVPKRVCFKGLDRSSSKEVRYARNEWHASLGVREWQEWGKEVEFTEKNDHISWGSG